MEWKKTSAYARSTLLAMLVGMLAAGCARKAPPPAAAPEPETVSVGYGTQSRDGVAGSIASVSERDWGNVRVARVEELLQGRVAGVQVTQNGNGDLSVRIRGAGSFMGSSEPLYIVDGMQMQALAGINPADIARIEVLKDAGTTAIYGARGGNGVVIITTRRPH